MANISQHIISIIAQFTGGPQAVSQIEKINTAFKGVGQEAAPTTQKIGDFERALRRAAIVAPVWMALRAGMQFFIQGIQQGITYLIDFEKQINFIKQTMQGISEVDVSNLRDQLKGLSAELGPSASAVASTFLTMRRLGLDAAVAMEATRMATELQVVAQSDNAEITKAVGLAYTIYGTSMEKSLSTQEKLNKITAEFAKMSATSLVTVDDLSREFNQVAKSGELAGLSFEEMISVLGILNSEGISNIQGFKTALLRTLADSTQIAKQLGLNITPDTKPFEVFMKVLQTFQTAIKGGAGLQAFGVLGELYGKGGRGGSQMILALSEAQEKLNKTVADLPIGAIQDFNKNLSDMENSLPNLTKRFENLKRQIFESFFVGLLHGKDFNESMSKGNLIMEQMGVIAEKVGNALHFLANPVKGVKEDLQDMSNEAENFEKKIEDGKKGLLTLADTSQLIADLQEKATKSGGALGDAYKNDAKELQKVIPTIVETEKTQERLAKVIIDWNSKHIEQQNRLNGLSSEGVLLSKEKLKLQEKIAKEEEDLIFKYTEANTEEEKTKIKRQLEIEQMTPEMQRLTFMQGNKEDRNLMIEMKSKLEATVRESMASVLANEAGLYTENSFRMFPEMHPKPGEETEKSPVNANITNYGAKEIIINNKFDLGGGATKEDMIKLVAEGVIKVIEGDDEFWNIAGKKVIKKLPAQ